MNDTPDNPNSPLARNLLLPLTPREVVVALMQAVRSKRKADVADGPWSTICIGDGQLA